MKMSVLTGNVWLRNGHKNVMSTITELRPDVLCLTELTQHSKYNEHIDMPAMIAELGYYAFYEPTITTNDMVMGTGIFSKLPLLKRRVLNVQDTDPSSYEAFVEDRKYLEAYVAIGADGEGVTIGTAHLSPPSRGTVQFRKEKAREADKAYEAVRDHSGRFILSLDANATPDYP